MSATSTPQAKTMSSRLLTMKFMQRAAHSPPTPAPADEPSSKRRKIESPSANEFNVDSLADRSAIQAAMASEEAKRQAALDKQAVEAGDTRWVLSYEDQKNISASPSSILRVVPTSFASLDAPGPRNKYEADMEDDKPAVVGRRSFGRFNRVIEKQQDPTIESSSEEEEEEEEESENSESDDEFDPTTQMIKAEQRQVAERAKNERRMKKQALKTEADKMAKKRRKDKPAVNLNTLTSLSGTNQDRGSKMECFKCGGPHLKKDCPDGGGGDFGGRRSGKRKFISGGGTSNAPRKKIHAEK